MVVLLRRAWWEALQGKGELGIGAVVRNQGVNDNGSEEPQRSQLSRGGKDSEVGPLTSQPVLTLVRP